MVQTAEHSHGLLGRMASLADATRLRLLRLLERRELGVVELCDVLQMPQSTISRHLKLLGEQGWTRGRRQGTGNMYSMVLDELDPAARRLWLLAREQTEAWPAVRQDQLRLERRKRQQASASSDFFNSAAEQWDQLRRQLYGELFGRAALLALLPSHWTVADLGCGTGTLTAELARHVRGVIGVDNSAAMLKAARHRLAALHGEGVRPRVELRRGDLEALPIEDGVCDAALLSLVLTYVAEPPAVLRQTARILKPGGRAVIVDLLEHDREDFRRQMGQRWMGFESGQLTRWLTDAGLTDISVRALPPEEKAKGPALCLVTASVSSIT